jgi:chromosome segregation ATPase
MSAFTPIGQHNQEGLGEGTFWPSFTDIMMVVVLIFLLATSLLIVRNWHLVNELQQSIEAERLAAQMIESTSQENATLEERLTNAEQLNSLLRLRILEKEEQLEKAQQEDIRRQQIILALETDKESLNKTIETTQTELNAAQEQIQIVTGESEKLAQQIAELKQQLEQQLQLTQAAQQELELANSEIAALNTTSEQQQKDIKLLEQEKIEYNRQLLTLKGDYEVVKSKYEQLIKPARSAKGKYVAEVYYVKQKNGVLIRYRDPANKDFKNLSLSDVEKKLQKLKQEKGEDLYVKIIIPKDSGLTYNEAWSFMKNLLDKYDYYYQPSAN